jgi:branched-chain amino acid transport system ATP-binding protein
MGAALVLQDVTANYGEARVLWGISLSIEEGDAVGLVGHNGAGKSTLFHVIAGALRSASGSITFEGRQILGKPPRLIARGGVSLVREGAPVFGSLTVGQHLELGRELALARKQEPPKIHEVAEWFPSLMRLLDTRATFLSGGQRQMLLLASAFVSRPRLLLLDEPSGGLSPVIAKDVMSAVGNMRKTGTTVLVAEQNSEWIEGLADQLYVMASGTIEAQTVTL